MAKFASLTERARDAIRSQDLSALGTLMDANFANRRALYGDGALGAANLRMISIAQKHGVPAKFPGSGGAVLGLWVGDAPMRALRHELEKNGCVFARLRAAPECHTE